MDGMVGRLGLRDIQQLEEDYIEKLMMVVSTIWIYYDSSKVDFCLCHLVFVIWS